MIFLIDMDGVIADFEQGFVNAWRERYPDRFYIEPEKRTTFYADEDYPSAWSGDIDDIVSGERFFADLPVINGAVEALNLLVAQGHEVRICTAPFHRAMQNCINGKVEWLERELGDEWLKRTIITRDKSLVHGDFLIDDKPNIQNAGAHEPSWEHVLFACSRNTNDQQAFSKLHGWAELPNWLRLHLGALL